MFYGISGLNSSIPNIANISNFANLTNGFSGGLNTMTQPASQTLSRETLSNFENKFSNQLSMMDGMGFTV